jgi:thiol-disulfide isomerase/thioredoxin
MPRALIATLLLVGVIGAGCTDTPSATNGEPTEGTAEAGATETVLTGLGEGAAEVDLAAYRGSPLVVNFFAHTCVPCLEEMPAIERVFQAGNGAFDVLGVAVNDNVDEALALVERTGITWDVATDPDGSFIRAMGGLYLPTTVLIDAEGEIVEVHTGELDDGELVGLLADHLGLHVEL